MNLGKNICLLRKSKGITQEELANAIGVSAQAVSKWENESSCPDISLLTEIADYFEVSVDDLLRGAESDFVSSTAEHENAKTTVSKKKTICIKVIDKNGKENNIRVPYKIGKGAINVAGVFGLCKDESDEIINLIDNENIDDIVDIVTENGEHITVTLE